VRVSRRTELGSPTVAKTNSRPIDAGSGTMSPWA
jgi:hypothetical protein